jgi:hypothetical protein
MAETYALTTPVTHPSLTTFVVERITIDRKAQSVYIQWVGDNNDVGSASYPTPAILNPLGVLQTTGLVMITTLNKANLSTKSLHRRVMEMLVADGYWPAGTINGTPE